MSPLGLIATIVIVTAIGAYQATAADIAVSTKNSAIIDGGPRSHNVMRHRHTVVDRRRHFVFWKLIGMPCLLTPDVIVRLNWNGPQCRWADNAM